MARYVLVDNSMEEDKIYMIKYLFSLVLYTDGDFVFRSPRNEQEDPMHLNRFIVYNYREYRINIDEFDDSYQYAFAFESSEYESEGLITFLKNLERDLDYGTHDWIVEELHTLVQNAIEFIQSKKEGVHTGSLRDGNWQPSLLCIRAEKVTFR